VFAELEMHLAMNSKVMPTPLVPAERSDVSALFRLEECLPHMAICQGLVSDLLESDRAYFRAAAHCEIFQGCQLIRMPGLESLAAGCVVQNLASCNSDDASAWIQSVEERLLHLDCTHARIYQQYPDRGLEQCFIQRGYRAVEEIALLNTFNTSTDVENKEIQLRPVCSEGDWSLKLSLHHDTAEDPDGHCSSAVSWLDMERRKCEAGYMEPFLIYSHDEPCGAVNFSLSGQVGRLKNLVIHPQWRRKSIGVEAARLIACMAQYHGKAAAGCFAIDNAPSLALYQSAGYLPVSKQTEWFKSLT
jgi:ribosomal protein S18 acetylase RimI-like enzyme